MDPDTRNAPRINALLQQYCCTTVFLTRKVPLEHPPPESKALSLEEAGVLPHDSSQAANTMYSASKDSFGLKFQFLY